MDPNEIIKAAPELLKHGAELVGALKLTEIAKAMLGPATGEFAERVKDEIRLYRFGRQLELLKKAEKMVQDAAFTPKAVPIKLLFPLIEGASLEEDEDLHTMWAALLANASSPENAEIVRPGFVSILKQMSPDEATVLDWFSHRNQGWSQHIGGLNLMKAEIEVGFATPEMAASMTRISDRMAICMDALEGTQLIRRKYVIFENDQRGFQITGAKDVQYSFQVSEMGRAFVTACRPPKPKS